MSATSLNESVSVREPRVDVLLSDTHVRVVADMPGVPVDGLSVHFERGVLTIDGKSASVHFRRSLVLRWRVDVDQESLRAELSNGVLTLDLPRVAVASQGRAIAVQEIDA